jgi:hypothetical protein
MFSISDKTGLECGNKINSMPLDSRKRVASECGATSDQSINVARPQAQASMAVIASARRSPAAACGEDSSSRRLCAVNLKPVKQ